MTGQTACPAPAPRTATTETNMASKQKTAPHDADRLKPLKVGSRVRCTDDGVEGRLVWANATAVKIRWDDGEQVTWRRDSLADRPVEILDQPAPPAPQPDEQVLAPAPQPATEGPTTESPPAQGAEPGAAEPTPPAQASAPERPDEQAVQPPSAEPAQTESGATAPTSSEG